MGRDPGGLPRQIGSGGLKAGDILFKHASKGAVSQKIKAGQAAHYHRALAALSDAPGGKSTSKAIDEGRDVAAFPDQSGRLRDAPSVEEATDITHVAVALGPDDVIEFDEGGATKWEIVARSGHGFVRGDMKLPSRTGKTYEVYRCTSETLWKKASDKASLVWDMTHTSPDAKGIQDKTPLTASYGLKKMLKTAIVGKKLESAKGPDVSLGYFEKTLDDWMSAADRKNAGRSANTNIQFFCSNFVVFVYLWAASEWQAEQGEIFGLDYVLGKKASVAPVELYLRISAAGKKFFHYAGTLTT
jgi:hypothetical protein